MSGRDVPGLLGFDRSKHGRCACGALATGGATNTCDTHRRDTAEEAAVAVFMEPCWDYLAKTHPGAQPEHVAQPTAPDLRAALEQNARLQDALDALDMATLWLHRTADFPHMPSHQAESWERKARSGRVALRAARAATLAPEETDHD